MALINAPHKWTPGVEYAFEDGSYGQRWVGEITAEPLTVAYTTLAIIKPFTMISYGGYFEYGAEGREGNRATIGTVGSGLVPDSSGTTRLLLSYTIWINSGELRLETSSFLRRTNRPYNIWVRYTKTA
jgi:hypothetical protein